MVKLNRTPRKLLLLSVIVIPLAGVFCCCCFLLLIPPDSKNQSSSSNVDGVQTANTQQNNPERIIPEEKKELLEPKCADSKGQEISRKCTECNKAEIELVNEDCGTTKKSVDDSKCNSLCPVKIEEKTPEKKAPTVYTPPKVEPSQPPARTCCKYCSKGKPCGDSCINKNYTCHKAPGCAC